MPLIDTVPCLLETCVNWKLLLKWGKCRVLFLLGCVGTCAGSGESYQEIYLAENESIFIFLANFQMDHFPDLTHPTNSSAGTRGNAVAAVRRGRTAPS